MPRIVGIDIPKEKKVYVALQYIYGIGETSTNKILKQAGIGRDVRGRTARGRFGTTPRRLYVERRGRS